MIDIQIKGAKEKNSFTLHPLLVLRTPRLPLMGEMVLDEQFLESVYLASPVVYKETIKQQKTVEKENNRKLEQTLSKYHLRSSNRCTPFALFAGCSVVPWGSQNINIIIDPKQIQRFARLDMDYLLKLVQKLVSFDEVRKNLIFLANNSIYKNGDELRYVECSTENGSRQYQISSVINSEPLIRVLTAARKGGTLQNLAALLTEYELEESQDFIEELVDSQLLISELQPKLTGEDFLEQILKTLKRISFDKSSNIKSYIDTLEEIMGILYEIRSLENGHMPLYLKIIKLLNNFDIPVDESKLLQIDSLNKVENGCLGKDVEKELSDLLVVLNKLTPKSLGKKNGVVKFCNDFNNRYGDKEMPLLNVLDPETGIGYISGNDVYDAPLIELIERNPIKKVETLNWTKTEELLHRILIANQGKKVVEILEEDLIGLEADWEDVPYSMSVIFKVIDKDENTLQIESVGGSSASNLLGRFAYMNPQINGIINDIAEWEIKSTPNKLLAEIVHQPENRICNVMIRPAARSYEIPYLAQSSLLDDFQIFTEDILVSIKNDKILLRSKKLNKEILPRLGNAHNFKQNDLPVYRFLCDLQNQGLRESFRFDWGELQKIYKRFPRVIYKKNILSPARWVIIKEELNGLKTKESIEKFREKNGVPNEVLLSEGDNELPIDFSNSLSIEIFLSAIKNKTQILLKEHIKPTNSNVWDKNSNAYANEFIGTFLKASVQGNSNANGIIVNSIKTKTKRDFAFGSEWNYYKIYCGEKTADKILIDGIRPLTKELLALDLIDKWFFIRYKDPEFHLRVRFHMPNPLRIGELIQCINRHLDLYINSGQIWKLQTEIYSRELERYGSENIESVERLFSIDSEYFLEMLEEAQDMDSEQIRWMYTLKSIDNLLDCFNLSLDEKERYSNNIRESFAKEHRLNKKMSYQLDLTYRNNKKNIWTVLDGGESGHNLSKILNISNEYNKKAKPIVNRMLERETGLKVKIESFLHSIIHMTVNRATVTEQRLHEFVIYHFLHQYYRSSTILNQSKDNKSKLLKQSNKAFNY